MDVVNQRTILALGDSLTAGSVYPGKRKPFPHPYEWELRKLLHNVSTIVQAGDILYIPTQDLTEILTTCILNLPSHPHR